MTAGLLACVLAGSMLTGTVSAGAAVTDGKLLVQDLSTDPGYYIFSDSDTRELTDAEINSISDARKQMAINEIYARRGRKFQLAEVQNYFNGKSWYQGVVDAADFDENIFNSYEVTNIQKLMQLSDYLLDGSDSHYLTDAEVDNLTLDELQLAINEIYARHGRKFVMKEYQDYFYAKSWYQGTVDAQDFDEKVFNTYESSNIQKLSNAMNEIRSRRAEVINDFAGVYILGNSQLGAVLEINVYTDRTCDSAPMGGEVASVISSLQLGNENASITQGYLHKQGDNLYSISGGDLDGAALQVLSNGVILSGQGTFDGTYTLTERYTS